MTTELDQAIAVSPRPDDPTTYDVELGDGWQIGAGVNGGILLATMANAVRSTFSGLPGGHRDPVSISAYYLSASRPGPAVVRTDVLRAGRSMSTAMTSLVQDDGSGEVERIRALATYGDLDALSDDVRTTATPPDLPPPDQCVSAADAPPGFLQHAGLLERLDLRLDPAYVGWALGTPSGEGRIQGWLRMADHREPDPLLLLLACDALPPVTFDLGELGWTPTLELTVHVRANPAPGWLRVAASTRNVAGGFLEEDAEVWDSTDRLVVQSRQLARAPRPS
ncbi:MAG: thioesterase family protein [Nocardioidaceae bacterium]